MHGLTKKIGLFTLGIMMGFALLELTVRVFGLAQQTSNFYEPDPLIGTRHVPNAHGLWRKKDFSTEISFNAEGFRDVDHTKEKTDGVYRIVVLGDSYVEALQVPLERAFHRVLADKLSGYIKDKKIEVINFGVSGFGLTQDYLALKHYGYKYSPDFVILAITTGNDIRNGHPDLEMDDSRPYFLLDKKGRLYLKPFRQQTGKGPDIKQRIMNKLFFPHSYVFLSQTLQPLWWQFKAKTKHVKPAQPNVLDTYVYRTSYSPVWDSAWKATLAVILKINDELREKGIRLLVLTLSDGDHQIDGTLQGYLEKRAMNTDSQWDSERPIKIIGKFCLISRIVHKDNITLSG